SSLTLGGRLGDVHHSPLPRTFFAGGQPGKPLQVAFDRSTRKRRGKHHLVGTSPSKIGHHQPYGVTPLPEIQQLEGGSPYQIGSLGGQGNGLTLLVTTGQARTRCGA